MSRVIVLALLIVFGGFGVCSAQWPWPTPQDTGALSELLGLLEETCLNISNPEPYCHNSDIGIPPGEYCLYYTNPNTEPGFRGYDFGYFNHHLGRCTGALRTLIDGQHWDCYYEQHPSYGRSLLPSDPALLVHLAEQAGRPTSAPAGVALWINGDWDYDYPAGPPGFHTSVDHYNWHNEVGWNPGPSAYCYTVDVGHSNCLCQCQNDTAPISFPSKGYLVFWEAGCPSSAQQWSWRDFWAVLIPAEKD